VVSLILIKDARLSIEDSSLIRDILIERGKIKSIEKNIEEVGAEIIDAGRMLVTCGLVGYRSTGSEGVTSKFTPGIRAIEELDLFGRDLLFHLNQGVTSIIVHPKNSNIISGSICVVKTHEALIDDYIIKEDAAIKVILGGDEGLGERMADIRSFIDLLKEYRKGREVPGKKGFNVRVAEKFLRKRDPIVFLAESSSAILDAVRLIERYELNGAIETEVDNTHTLKAVEDEGIYIIKGKKEKSPINTEVLKSALDFNKKIARFLNIDHRIGELREGMDADIVIWDDSGDILEVMSVIIDGNLVGRINR